MRAIGGEYVFLPFVTNALALGWVSDLIGTVLKKANLSKGRDAKPPVYGRKPRTAEPPVSPG